MALKYFTYENRKRIEESLLHETDIACLPTLGHGVDFGIGEICLEETKDNDGNDRFELYFAVNYDKYQHKIFDNIEDAINALVEYYKKWDMVDKPNKMKKIIYQELGLKMDIFDEKYLPENQLHTRFVDDFFDKYTESRELTEDELRSIITLKRLLNVFSEKLKALYIGDVSLSPADTPGISMFKIDDDSWVVWHSFDGMYIGAKNCNSVDEACIGVLWNLLKDCRWSFREAAIKIFYKKREENQSMGLPELTAFAKENRYTLPKAKTRNRALFIRK